LAPIYARRMDGFCNQNADQLGYLAGPSLLTVYVGVVECAPASPYTYSSSTHRFPDERTPIEATPLSATSAELGLGLGLGLGLDSLSHSSSHALPFFSPPSFHTLSLSPRSLVCGGQASPHKPRLVVSHSTCPPLSSSPHAHSFVLGTAVINTHTPFSLFGISLACPRHTSSSLRTRSPSFQPPGTGLHHLQPRPGSFGIEPTVTELIFVRL
jgi:hypothetical protein